MAYNESYRSDFAIDWRYSVENYRRTLLDGFLDRGNGVDTFMCTRDVGPRMMTSLLQAYSPVRHSTTEEQHQLPTSLDQSQWFLHSERINMLNRNLRLVGVMRLCLDYAQEGRALYDQVLITRFDIWYTRPLRHLSIHPDKFNIATHLAPHKLIDDNLYILPFRLLRRFHDLMAARNVSRSTWTSHHLKGPIQRHVAPIHVIMDQGASVRFWNSSLVTLVRCKRPHGSERRCRPASTPSALDRFAPNIPFASWDAVVAYKRDLLTRMLSESRQRCGSSRPFQLHAPADSALRVGMRVLLMNLRTRSMAWLNGSIAVVQGGPRVNTSVVVPVQVLYPALRPELEYRPVTWTLKPHQVAPGTGLTPDEVEWCMHLPK